MKTFLSAAFLAAFVSLSSCGSGEGEKGKTDSTHTDTSAHAKPDPGTQPVDPPLDMPAQDFCKQNITELIELVKKSDFKAASEYIVYRGKDATRKWKSQADYSLEEDKMQVDKLCSKLKGMLSDMKNITFDNFSTEKESEGEWQIWQVTVYNNDDTDQPLMFACLKIDGAKKIYLLGDIDS